MINTELRPLRDRRPHRFWFGALFAFVMSAVLLAAGCGSEEATPLGQVRSELGGRIPRDFRPIPPMGERFRLTELPADEDHADAVAREIARQKRDRAADPCGRCAEGACPLQCIFADELVEGVENAEMVVDCIECGRETGFLPRPLLRLEQVGEKTIELSWDAVDGATDYTVYGMQWANTEPTGGAQSSLVWHTQETLLRLTLEEGSSYSFQLVAWTEGRRSQPSLPVQIDL